jgi:hypothetical protein
MKKIITSALAMIAMVAAVAMPVQADPNHPDNNANARYLTTSFDWVVPGNHARVTTTLTCQNRRDVLIETKYRPVHAHNWEGLPIARQNIFLNFRYVMEHKNGNEWDDFWATGALAKTTWYENDGTPKVGFDTHTRTDSETVDRAGRPMFAIDSIKGHAQYKIWGESQTRHAEPFTINLPKTYWVNCKHYKF